MSVEKAEAILAITELIVKYGVPTAIATIKTLRTEDPTLEQILALKDRVRDPESYFVKKDALVT